MKNLFKATIFSAAIMLAAPQVTSAATKHTKPVKYHEYLQEVTFTKYDIFGEGEAFINRHVPTAAGGCSTVRNGNLVGRNYDWSYNNDTTFVVHVPAAKGRHASVGVATCPREKAMPHMDEVTREDLLDNVVYFTMDGTNDAGVTIVTNMLKADFGTTTATNPGAKRLSSAQVARYVLDNAGSVDEAVELIKGVDIYMPYISDLHWAISDPKQSVVVEIINGEVKVKRDQYIMTNFAVNVPYYQKRALGIERYNILKTYYRESSTEEGMKTLMDRVRFGRIFDCDASDVWISDINGEVYNGEMFTVYNMKKNRQLYVDFLKADRNNPRGHRSTWQTFYNCLYDLTKHTLVLKVQEENTEYKFSLEQKPATK